jgi:hypothetical protein
MPSFLRHSLLLFSSSLLAGFLLFHSSCSQRENLRAKEIPEAVKAYLYGWTSGIISKDAAIRIRFATAAVGPDLIGQQASEVLAFTPATEGMAVWEDEYTLRFEPEEPWENGAAYLARVSLDEVFDNLPPQARSFEFDFMVRHQSIQVNLLDLQAERDADLSRHRVHGELITSDIADAAELEKILQARQGGRALPLRWDHAADGLTHHFVVSEVQRAGKPSSLEVSWDGSGAGIPSKGKQTFQIPALGDFKLLSARMVPGESQYLVLNFSDPLLSTQDLGGLLRLAAVNSEYGYEDYLDTPDMNLMMDGNRLVIYPARRLQGKLRVEVLAGIRNYEGKPLPNAGTVELEVNPGLPALRLAGRGSILPATADYRVLPFEAVNLQAVEVEVFKIYHNNIHAFLQTSELDDPNNYEMSRVGRVISREMVPLKGLNPEANPAAWTRYALDLNKLFNADPDAIYQVRIGFRRDYALVNCPNASASDNLKIPGRTSFLDESGEIRSMWNDFYGIEGYYDNFSWEHRGDPCYPAYYNYEHFVKSNVLVSDLGITAKGSAEGNWMVAVADLGSTDPVAAVELEFYDYQQQLILTAKTDRNGMASLNLSRKPFLILAKKEKMKGFLKTGDGNSLSLSNFDIKGEASQKGLRGFIYGERGVWRPGDSLFLHFMLEDKGETLPADYPVVLELNNPMGQLYYKTVSTLNVNKIYSFPLATHQDAPTGNWTATVRAGSATFTKTLKIETVKPNRLRIDMALGKEEISVRDGAFPCEVDVNWLNGAIGKGLKVQVEALATSKNTEFSRFPGFEFDDPARSWERSLPMMLYEGVTDEQGHVSLTIPPISKGETAPGKLNVSFEARAFEKGGDFSISTMNFVYSPYTAYAGLRIPTGPGGGKELDMGKDSQLSLAAVDEKGHPQKGRILKVGLYKVEWRWWWEAGSDYVSHFNSSDHLNAIRAETVTTGADGKASWKVRPAEWGRYLVRVCDSQSGHCTGDFFNAGYPWYAEGSGIRERQEAAMMTFTASKEKYQVGQDVAITIPAGRDGRVLVTIESGSRVLRSFWEEVREGENRIEFEATADMAPAVYVHASLIQPHGQSGNDLPIRMYGVIPVGVEDPGTVLHPVLNTESQLRPGQEFTVEVSEADNEKMAYTLAIVDEGLLGLTSFKTPDPHAAFYAREALGVKTWDLYDHVLGAYGGEMERVLSIGGDGAFSVEQARKNANRFKPVVLHAGPFYLRGGKQQHKFRMPEYVGSVRVMLVAANGAGAYGQAEQAVKVSKPLMVLATLPRVLGTGETIRVPLSVFATAGMLSNVAVELSEPTALSTLSGGGGRQASSSETGEKLVWFEVKTGQRTGVAKFIATARSGKETAKQEIEIQVRNPNPVVTDVYAGTVQPGQHWEQTCQPIGGAGTDEVLLEVSSIPALQLGSRLAYLIQYPHGCIEQITSGAFPQLYLDRLMNLGETQRIKARQNVESAITKLKNYQMGAGGFAYWPGGDADNWGSSYAGHFLLEAKQAGYAVPESLISRFVKFQQGMARRWNPDSRGDAYSWTELDQAYRLYTLALARQPELSAMNRMRELKGLSAEARWRLAAAYALAGKKDVGRQLTRNVPATANKYEVWGPTYGSVLRDQAMMLETQVLLEDYTAAGANVRTVAESLSRDEWYSTQATAYALLSIAKFAGKSKIGEEFHFSYDDGSGKVVEASSKLPVMQVSLPAAAASRLLKVKNLGGAMLFTRLLVSGQPQAGDATVATASNVKLSVSYSLPSGKKVNPAALPQGTDFIAEVMVTHTGQRAADFSEMALTQIFPAGWEIINTRLSEASGYNNMASPEYQDIRDDRVLTYFDLRRSSMQLIRVRLNAAYQGRFFLPAVSCEAMYDRSVSARQPGMWVEVVNAEEPI